MYTFKIKAYCSSVLNKCISILLYWYHKRGSLKHSSSHTSIFTTQSSQLMITLFPGATQKNILVSPAQLKRSQETYLQILRGSLGYPQFVQNTRILRSRSSFVIKYLTTKIPQFNHWYYASVNPRIQPKDPVGPCFLIPHLYCKVLSQQNQVISYQFKH